MKKELSLLLIVFIMQGSLLGEFKNLQTHLNDSEITKKCLENSQELLFSDSSIAIMCYCLNNKFDTIQQAYEKAIEQKRQLKEVQDKVSNHLDSKKEKDNNRFTIRHILIGDLGSEDSEELKKELDTYNNALHKANEQAYNAAELKLKK